MTVGIEATTKQNVALSIRKALSWAKQELVGSQSPGLDARLLLEHLLGVNHAYLISHDQETLSSDEWFDYQAAVIRARKGEPIPYIVCRTDFYGREFVVSPAVLIPRPETEELTKLAIEWAHDRPDCHIADIGTGSGCVAVTLACELPTARISAVDVSLSALAVARENAARHDVVERIHFLAGNLLAPLGSPCDLIVANLPYITDAEWTTLDDGVKSYEPARALRGGPDGLLFIRQLLKQAVAGQLRSRGAVLLEIGWRQGEAARRLAQENLPRAEVTLLQDLAGCDRVIKIQA